MGPEAESRHRITNSEESRGAGDPRWGAEKGNQAPHEDWGTGTPVLPHARSLPGPHQARGPEASAPLTLGTPSSLKGGPGPARWGPPGA